MQYFSRNRYQYRRDWEGFFSGLVWEMFFSPFLLDLFLAFCFSAFSLLCLLCFLAFFDSLLSFLCFSAALGLYVVACVFCNSISFMLYVPWSKHGLVSHKRD